MRARLLIYLALVLIVFSLLGGIYIPEYLRESFLARVRTVHVGDTREEVEHKLGAPNQRYPRGGQLIDDVGKKNLLVWLLVPESPETWCYGTPFRIRWLGPAKEDVIIEFDKEGNVSRVKIPDD
jgi:hypothetical protein